MCVSFLLVQTRLTPYDSAKSNFLKQLAETQLFLTLLISIVLRGDLVGEALGADGYDGILTSVNVFMVPLALSIFSLQGLWAIIRKVVTKGKEVRVLQKPARAEQQTQQPAIVSGP